MKTSKNNLAKFATFMKAFEINCDVKERTKEQINFYFTVFRPFPISEVEKAFSRVLHDWIYNRFPPVGVFMKAIEKEQPLLEDIAEIQAAEVIKQMQLHGIYGTPEFKDPITKELTKHRFVLATLCRTMKDGDEKWFVKEFIKAYKAFERNKENLLIEIPPELKQITDNLFEKIE